MRQLLAATAAPEEAVLLVRLLADEGIVGARSTAGREGPVVGRAVRRSGSRPLLVAEVLENWQTDVKAACLVRWSREGVVSGDTSTVEGLQEEVRRCYLEELEVYGRQATSSSSGSGGDSGSDPWAALRPRGRVVDAVNSATVPVRIMSTLPEHITAAALERAGILCAADTATSFSSNSSSEKVACDVHVLQSHTLEDAACTAAEEAVAAHAHLQLVVDRQGRAEKLREVLQLTGSPPAAATAAAVAASAAAAAIAGELMPPTVSGSSKASRKAGSKNVVPSCPAPCIYVADWCCVTASQRAAAGTGLLPDHRLVDLLGCSDSALVMDGIAWR